jgi:intron-binding protein aquarius
MPCIANESNKFKYVQITTSPNALHVPRSLTGTLWRAVLHYQQRVAFQHFMPTLRSFALANVGSVENPRMLKQYLQVLDDQQLFSLAQHLHIFDADSNAPVTRDFIFQVLLSMHEKRRSQLDDINALPLYPTEVYRMLCAWIAYTLCCLQHDNRLDGCVVQELMWDQSTIPVSDASHASNETLALPKLNLQFLTLQDYLLRNFKLFRLEAAYEIRQDLEDVLRRVNPRKTDGGQTEFTGWARMALPIRKFSITKVAKPNLGETQPAYVAAEVCICNSLSLSLSLSWSLMCIGLVWFGLVWFGLVLICTVSVGYRSSHSTRSNSK